MSGCNERAVSGLDEELEEIDNTIIEYNIKVRNLIERRCELLAQRENAQMQDVLDYIIEKGITPREALYRLGAPVTP